MASESTLSLTKALNKLQKLQEERLQKPTTSPDPLPTPNSTLHTPNSALGTPHSQLHTPHSEWVFSINFLRHETAPRHVRRAIAYGAIGYLMVNLIFFIFLFEIGSSLRSDRKKLQTQLRESSPSSSVPSAVKQEMETMYQQAVTDLSQLTTAIGREKDRFPVSGKLAALVKTLPARTWITALSGDRINRKITIEACYLINPETPYELPTKKWTDALRADPSFGNELKRLDLAESSQRMQEKAELFTFQLVAEWEK